MPPLLPPPTFKYKLHTYSRKQHTEPYIIPATPPPEVRTFGLKLGHATGTQIRTSTKLSPRHKNRCVLDFSGNENSGANTSI